MLDVILYGFDARGLLTLQEKTFSNLRQLARHFRSSDGGMCWQWAEVEVSAESGETRVVKYTADSLRGMVITSSRTTCVN